MKIINKEQRRIEILELSKGAHFTVNTANFANENEGVLPYLINLLTREELMEIKDSIYKNIKGSNENNRYWSRLNNLIQEMKPGEVFKFKPDLDIEDISIHLLDWEIELLEEYGLLEPSKIIESKHGKGEVMEEQKTKLDELLLLSDKIGFAENKFKKYLQSLSDSEIEEMKEKLEKESEDKYFADYHTLDELGLEIERRI